MIISDQFYEEWDECNIWDPGVNDPTRDDLLDLLKLVDEAPDERPIQKLLEARPRLWLGTQRTGHGTWVFPQKRLGSEFIPDFLIASGSSGGLFWELVEIESPTATPFLKNGEQSAKLRTAVSQIEDWRNWLTNNITYARNPKKLDGLGLESIHPRSSGKIIIGRRTNFPDKYNTVRQSLWHDKHITVMSYDRFLEQIAFGIFRGQTRDEMTAIIHNLRQKKFDEKFSL